jgi:hypothetical protein
MNQVYKKMVLELAPYEVDPPVQYQTIKRKTFSPNECHWTAYKYMMSLDKAVAEKTVFIRGYYKELARAEDDRDTMLTAGHSWVELPGEIVFDGVLKRFYEAKEYYTIKNVNKYKEYSRKEINDLYLRVNFEYTDPYLIELKLKD